MDILRALVFRTLAAGLCIGGLALFGCSGGGGGGGGAQQGTFHDGPVGGIEYHSGSQSGLTDADGTFFFDGTTVTFSIGGIVLGMGTPSGFMTPIDLVPGAVDETDPVVTNIARLLQTFDDDGDPSNGITITEAVRIAAEGQTIDFDPAVFEAQWDALPAELTGGLVLVSSEDAQAHLSGTLLGELAGTFSGTFTGDAQGTFQISVDSSGALTGTISSLDPAEPSYDITGSLSSSGQFSGSGMEVIGETTFETTFTGAVVFDGRMEGTWSTVGSDQSEFSGTFVGGEDAQPPGPPPVGGACDVEGLPGHVVRFVVTKEDDQGQPLSGPPITLDTCAAFECNGVIDICTLQVFDIPGGDRFFQFLTPLNTCFGFDARVADPDTGEIFDFSGQPVRPFGVVPAEQPNVPPSPFASGFATGSLGTTGSFEFFEYIPGDTENNGFRDFLITNTPCPGSIGE